MNPSNHIDVKILCYERWDSLQRLLASLTIQQVTNFTYSLEVIDNSIHSPLSGAQVMRIKECYGAGYYYAGLSNIAAGRNAALLRCSAPYLAFIDDDEVASPTWLAALFAEMEKSGSDVVMGLSLARYGGSQHWLTGADIFQPQVALPGARDGFVESTANCLMRMTPLREVRVRFDERFGKCGGSDLEFFTRLRCLSFRFSYAPLGVTYEEYDDSRVNWRWIARRAFRCGGARGAVLSRYEKSRYAQEVVTVFREIARVFLPSRRTAGHRFWTLFLFSGLLFFSISGRVLSEYENGRFRFARFTHPRWSVLGICWARLLWGWK